MFNAIAVTTVIVFSTILPRFFSGHQLSISKMFYVIREIEEPTIEKIIQELDRTCKTVLDFVYEVKDALDDDPDFDLTGVCEADESYVTAGEKGLDQDEPRNRGLKKDEEPSSQTNSQS